MKYFMFSMMCLVCVMGASAAMIFVPADHPTIQEAIDAAVDGDIVLVAPGVYAGNNDFKGKAIIVSSAYGPESCIVDSKYANDSFGFKFENGETETSLLAGFTICNSYSCEIHPGAIRIRNASPRIFNCVIRDNVSVYGGYDDCLSPVGGIYLENSNAFLWNCLIHHNEGIVGGMWNMSLPIGAMWCKNSSITAINCTITDNTASNVSTGTCPGINFSGNSSPYFRNLIVPDRSYFANAVNPDVEFCNITNYSSGTGNFSQPSQFVTGPYGDYYLKCIAAGNDVDSPCINTGSAPADQICFDTSAEVVCMNMYTTRIDQVLDTGTVDMGYHYGRRPTDIGTRLDISTSWVTKYVDFWLHAWIHNFTTPRQNVVLFVILDVDGALFFWDSWGTDVDYQVIDVPLGMTRVTVIPKFQWPYLTSTMDNLVFWCAMTDASMTEILGGMNGLSHVQFGYGPL